MKSIVKRFTLLLTIILTIIWGISISYNTNLPNQIQLYKGDELSLENNNLVKASNLKEIDLVSGKKGKVVNQRNGEENYEVQLKLFGIIPIKSIKVNVVNEMYVAVSGESFGIKIFTDGVMVVGMTEVDTEGGNLNPAKEAGIKTGDVIISINGIKVNSNQDVADIIENSNGKNVKCLIIRNTKKYNISFKPALSLIETKFKAGLWVRDSSAGIGTMTFYSTVNGVFGGLGHAVCDVDTGMLLPLDSGEIVGTQISSINKAKAGKAGEISGYFTNEKLGDLISNSDVGIYGVLSEYNFSKKLTKIALKQEVVTGKAKILTTIDNNGPRYYDCVVEKIKYSDDINQNMVIRITDESLLAKTGGIVQGMSGSPVIQNNLLIGSVTHVFVNDPKKGYAVFAENMYNQSQKSYKEYLKNNSAS